MRIGLAVLAGVAFLSTNSVASQWLCLDAYHVHRPVTMGLVDHEFIGISLSGKSGQTDYRVFGLPKGDSDRTFFKKAVEQNRTDALEHLGESCDPNTIHRVLRIAGEMSQELQEPHKNWGYYLGRMAITPVVGKPCGNAADAIGTVIEDELNN